MIGQVFTETVIGALDGLAAGADANAGRHWDSPGVGAQGGVVLSWGFASVLQMAALGLGLGLAASGRGRYGQPLANQGAGLIARGLSFKLGQHGQANPVPTTG